MKRGVLAIIMVATMILVAGWNLSQEEKEMTLSGLILCNIEALASTEGGDGDYCVMHVNCYDKEGNPTGNSSASSYKGNDNCKRGYHSHGCSSCRS